MTDQSSNPTNPNGNQQRDEEVTATPPVHPPTRSLEDTLESIRSRVETALSGQEAQNVQRWVRERADDVERAMQGPRAQEVRVSLEKKLNDISQRLDTAIASSSGKNLQDRVSGLMEEMGDAVERALKSPATTEVRSVLARFFADLAQRIAPPSSQPDATEADAPAEGTIDRMEQEKPSGPHS